MGMPLFRLLFRKMWNTRWLTLSSFLGLFIAVAFTTSIPMYTDGALKRVVAASLQEKNDGLPAGSILIRYQASGNDRAELDSLAKVQDYIDEMLAYKKRGFPAYKVHPPGPWKLDMEIHRAVREAATAKQQAEAARNAASKQIGQAKAQKDEARAQRVGIVAVSGVAVALAAVSVGYFATGEQKVEATAAHKNDVPFYLPGQNPFIQDWSKQFGLPFEAVFGGAPTTYPDYLPTMERLMNR